MNTTERGRWEETRAVIHIEKTAPKSSSAIGRGIDTRSTSSPERERFGPLWKSGCAGGALEHRGSRRSTARSRNPSFRPHVTSYAFTTSTHRKSVSTSPSSTSATCAASTTFPTRSFACPLEVSLCHEEACILRAFRWPFKQPLQRIPLWT